MEQNMMIVLCIGLSTCLVLLILVVIFLVIKIFRVKHQRNTSEDNVPVQVLSPPKPEIVRDSVILAEEGVYLDRSHSDCVTSTPCITSNNSEASNNNLDDDDDVNTRSIITYCKHHMFGSTFTIEPATNEENENTDNLIYITNFEQRMEDVLDEGTSLLESSKDDDNEDTINENKTETIIHTVEEENNNEESDEEDKILAEDSLMKEKHLLHTTISDSMVNITFGYC